MKKLSMILALILAGAMIFGMAGCNGSSDGNETTTEAKPAAGTKAIPKGNIKIGVLYITGADETSGYTYAHHKGILEMISTLGLNKDNQLVIKDKIDDTNVSDTNAAIQEMIDAGCNIIFANSFNYMNAMEDFAKKPENAHIVFSHCSGFLSNPNNFNNYFGRIYEARFLSGLAAGKKAKQLFDADPANGKKLGYVAAMGVENSEVTGGINAFALGVQTVFPEAEIKVKVTGSWYDPAGEANAAKALIEEGCNVIAQHCDTDGPQVEAQNKKVFGCGYNSDMTAAAPDAHLCAPVWNWGVYYTAAVEQVINGAWKSVNYFEGMNKSLIGLSPINEKIAAPGTKEIVEEYQNKIERGEFFVFAGPIVDNKGNEIIKAGEQLTDKQITGEINYYIKGVTQ